MKILFFIDHIGGGGRERRMAQLVLALDRQSDIRMMAITATPSIDYIEVLRTSLEIRVVSDKYHLSRLNKYISIIEEFRPDVIHLWSETSMYCFVIPLLAKKYGCKFIVGFVADGMPLSVHPFIQRLSIQFAFHKADAIVSNSVAGLVAKKAPKKKSRVIYNGFDKNRIVSVDKNRKKSELGISCKWLVTMCARVNKAKDWDMFISLAKMGASSDMYFLAVGGGELLEHYRNVIEREKLINVSFVGRRSDIMEILGASDICVLFTNAGSHAEGVSNSIMESMAVGVPVIATAGGGTSEIITSGIDGFIIEPKDTDGAFVLVRHLINEESTRIAMGERAKKTIRERFSLDGMCKEYLSLYRSLLNTENF